MNDNTKVILAPTKELAETTHADATVEAEYGDYCIEGKTVTLAHHGSRSSNPAPCNADVKPLDISKPQTILISHIDLDTLGGIMALTGEKPYDPSFWAAAEKIDRETAAAIESKLVAENRFVRAFQTDGVFCSASYYSPK